MFQFGNAITLVRFKNFPSASMSIETDRGDDAYYALGGHTARGSQVTCTPGRLPYQHSTTHTTHYTASTNAITKRRVATIIRPPQLPSIIPLRMTRKLTMTLVISNTSKVNWTQAVYCNGIKRTD